MNILFIAKNIPSPALKENKVIFTIAEHLSNTAKISFLYPHEYVPWGLHFLQKYRPYYNVQNWTHNDFNITAVPYVRLPFKGMAFKFFNSIPKKALKAFDKDTELIHAHFILPDGYLAYLLSQKYDKPYIVTVRKSDIALAKTLNKQSNDFKKIRLVLENAKAIFTLNGSQKAYLENTFNLPIQIIPHGIESSVFKQKTNTPKTDEHIHISTVGNAISLKNIEWVINAVKGYVGTKEVILHVVGDGPLISHYKELSKGHDNIKIYGRVPREQVLDIMDQSDIFALPSDNESFGLVYVEAAAKKNAIIGYKHQGVWGVFSEDEMKFIDNYGQFKNTLYQLIENAELRTSLAEASFQKAKELTWGKVIAKYIDNYKKILD